jgi:glycosyltransferase involved in cell wall biosynthesis
MRPRPRVLHLFSDWKWTGPAEPIVTLCRQLRRHGYAVDLACGRPARDYPDSIERHARQRHVEPVFDFQLRKGGNPFVNLPDIAKLKEYVEREEVEIVHVHTGHDHYIGSRASRKATNRPFIVRTNHRGVPLPSTPLNRWVVRGHTDGWVAYTGRCRDEDVRRFELEPKHATVIDGAVDLEKFNPSRADNGVRLELGFEPGHVVAGIVARVQSHRRFDVLIPALAKAMSVEPSLRMMIVGRGTHIKTLAVEPVHRLGIADKVVFTGYRRGDYAEYLAAMDFKIFLVPGSDGSCRAVREAMAMGKPIVAADRGLLPELVEDGRCGIVVEDTVEDLAGAILKMARNPELRERLGRNAAKKARERFDIERQVEIIAELYMRLAEGR